MTATEEVVVDTIAMHMVEVVVEGIVKIATVNTMTDQCVTLV